MGLKVSKATVQEYLQLIEDAILFFYIYLLINPLQEAVKSPRKVFIVDTGLLNVYGVQERVAKANGEHRVFRSIREENIDPTIS